MDIEYLLWLQQLREALGPGVEKFFLIVTSIPTGPVTIGICALLYWCWDKHGGICMLFCFCCGNLMNQLCKVTACVYRPWVRSELVHPSTDAIAGATGYSFPSGHATITTAAYGSLGWRYRKRGQWGKVLLAVCIVFILLVCFSRNFLGVHTPQDVFVGVAVGLAAIVIGFKLDAWLGDKTAAGKPTKNNRDVKVVAVLLVICVVAFAYVALKPYPLDYEGGRLIVDPEKMRVDAYEAVGSMAGFAVGSVLERRFVGFSTECPTRQKVYRFIVGALVAGALYLLAPMTFAAILPESLGDLAMTLGMFCGVLGVTYVAPAVFEASYRRLFAS